MWCAASSCHTKIDPGLELSDLTQQVCPLLWYPGWRLVLGRGSGCQAIPTHQQHGLLSPPYSAGVGAQFAKWGPEQDWLLSQKHSGEGGGLGVWVDWCAWLRVCSAGRAPASPTWGLSSDPSTAKKKKKKRKKEMRFLSSSIYFHWGAGEGGIAGIKEENMYQ
jgi:hypothetical protein